MSTGEALNTGEEMQLVVFALGKEFFGIDVMKVQEIIRTPSITVVPQAPSYVEGVTNLRGTILPVIDTRVRFGMPKAERAVTNRVMVVDVEGRTVGLSVDAVSEVLRVDTRELEPAPEVVAGAGKGSIRGLVKSDGGKKVVMVVDPVRLCGGNQATASSLSVSAGSGILSAAGDRKAEEEGKLEEVQLVSFLLGGEEFALEIENVREIIRYPQVVQVPGVPDYIKGVFSLRERLLPIVDLRIRLGIGEPQVTDSTRVVITDIGSLQLGLVVDRVFEVARISRESIFPPPQALEQGREGRLQGIVRLENGKRLILLLNLQDVVASEDFQNLGEWEKGKGEIAEASDSSLDGMHEEQMVVFKLAGEQYGVSISQVQEINRLSRITRVPKAARFVEGVVNLRGEVIPVIDLRKRFDLEVQEYNEFTRIIVSDIKNRKIGIIVDEVLEVLRVPKRFLEEAPEIIHGEGLQQFITGIANLSGRVILQIDIARILAESEWSKLDDISSPKTAEAEKPSVTLKKQGRGRQNEPKDTGADSG